MAKKYYNLKRSLTKIIKSSLYKLHGYEVNIYEIEKALPKLSKELLCKCPIYAYKEESAYFLEDKSAPYTPIVKPELVEKRFKTSIVILNYDNAAINYIESSFSVRGITEILYLFTSEPNKTMAQ